MIRRAQLAPSDLRRETAEKRVVVGTALTYGEIYEAPRGSYRETIRPRALKPRRSVVLGVQHDPGKLLAGDPGSLTVHYGDDAIRFRAELPSTAVADETLALIDAGALNGASIEFFPRESEMRAGVRNILSGMLLGISLVAHPAYKQTRVSRWLYAI